MTTKRERGKRLRVYLAAKDIKQKDFAARCEVSEATVSKWCAGSLPTATHFDRIYQVTDGEIGPDAWLSEDARAEVSDA